ncbi:hypothetical protein H0H81_003412 [Sphagnurus paluster]|jgi:hypothetical protein|uniref:Cyclin N-terminal domain-containing protein n=1 Tax=Sphagnurus paluster TaxID=117069 RepID=A0A9P7GN31_9AGAR|nr:hypothetical protein H0H81_003412 [Sphagnurus paluster]
MAAPHPDPRRISTNAPRSRYQQVQVQPTAPIPSSQPPPPRAVDPFYGHGDLAQLCARFITHLFDCPEVPPGPGPAKPQSSLPNFIAYGLHRTKLHPSVTFAALILLQRLKARFPTARGSSGHRLFISAFMIASKVICDDTYSNKSWGIVAQAMFTLREINQMEREMCNYLEWELNVDNTILTNFETRLREDFRSPSGPYPTYPLSMVSKRAARAAASSPVAETNDTTSPIPNFGQRSQPTPSGSPQSETAWSSPRTPDTPSPAYSNSTSPASSASPATPVGGEDYSARVRGYDSMPVFSITGEGHPVHPLKGQMFATAMPSSW